MSYKSVYKDQGNAVTTEEEMDSKIAIGNLGKYYRYLGPSGKYQYGYLYLLTEPLRFISYEPFGSQGTDDIYFQIYDPSTASVETEEIWYKEIQGELIFVEEGNYE